MKHIIQTAPGSIEPGSLLDRAGPEDAGSAIRTHAVYVVFTTIEDTLAAVRVAGDFANALSVPVNLIDFRPVPYALPLDRPAGKSPVEAEAFVSRLQAEGHDVLVRVCLCRDERRGIQSAFAGPSLVVVGGRRRWRPTALNRLRRWLEKAGHLVVVVEAGRSIPRVFEKERSHA